MESPPLQIGDHVFIVSLRFPFTGHLIEDRGGRWVVELDQPFWRWSRLTISASRLTRLPENP